jgi:hypothetical protein
MSRASLVIALVEDQRQQRFVRDYLRRTGYTREVRWEPLPAGSKGSAERWVRSKYAAVVQAFRGRSHRARTILIVAIDADMVAVEHRHQQFAEELAGAGQNPRSPNEAIAHLVPKRNIETWILSLGGLAVDEFEDHHSDGRIDAFLPTSAQTLFDRTRPGAALPVTCVDSLRAAVPELRRLGL